MTKMFFVTNKMSVFIFFNQMAFWDPSVIRATRSLFQHGQHLKDVSGNSFSGIIPFKPHTLSLSFTCCLSTASLKKWEPVPDYTHPFPFFLSPTQADDVLSV